MKKEGPYCFRERQMKVLPTDLGGRWNGPRGSPAYRVELCSSYAQPLNPSYISFKRKKKKSIYGIAIPLPLFLTKIFILKVTSESFYKFG